MKLRSKKKFSLFKIISKLANKKININNIKFTLVALIYIYISIVIFVVGWLRPTFVIFSSIAIICGFYQYYITNKTNLNKKTPIYVSGKIIFLIATVILLLGTILGWTGMFVQPGDWHKHNAVLNDLVKYEWPVTYINGNEHSMLTYYLGQYMVPSLVGKIFSSLQVTQITNGFWAMIGLFIAVLGTFKITKSDNTKKQLITFLIILLFSSCIVLAQYLGRIFIPNKDIGSGHWFMYANNYFLQFSANIVLLRWVMPQCIIAWIVMSLLYDNKYDIKNYVFIGLPVLFYSSFSFIALILILVVLAIIKLITEKKKKDIISDIFSASNVSLSLTLGIIFILYFSGNVFSVKTNNTNFVLIHYGLKNISIYFFFIMSFIPYTLLLFKDNRKNPFYWLATIILLILPFGKMGIYNDLVMRTSIIPLFIYMILCIHKLYDSKTSDITKVVLIVFLIMGSHSSFAELEQCNKISITKNFSSLQSYANRSLNVQEDLKYNYFSYDLGKNFFYRNMAKPRKSKKTSQK